MILEFVCVLHYHCDFVVCVGPGCCWTVSMQPNKRKERRR